MSAPFLRRAVCAPLRLSLCCLLLISGMRSSGFNSLAFAQSVLTQHNDNQRTGANLGETQLTPANVSRLISRYKLDVSGNRGPNVQNTIGAQPLYVARVMVKGQPHEVLYVSTRQGLIYAFDVGSPTPKNFWPKPLEMIDPRKLRAEELQGMDGRYQDDPLWNADPTTRNLCYQTHGPVGIASTPVIDEATNTMWVVYRTSSPFGPAQYNSTAKNPYDAKFWVRKLDIRTGATVAEREIVLPANDPDRALFDPNKIITRTGLLLMNGVIYIAFSGAVCDTGAGEPITKKDAKGNPIPGQMPVHGWILAVDANSLGVIAGRVTTPNSKLGGIWQSGAGLASDPNGLVFALTGNNEADNRDENPTLNTQTELSTALVRVQLNRLTNNLDEGHYTAHNWYRLDTGARFPKDPFTVLPCQPVFACSDQTGGVAADSDPASGGPVVLPNGLVIGGGKQGRFYLLDPHNMKVVKQSFQAFYNSWHPGISPCDYDQDQMFGPNIHGAPVVWHPAGLPYALLYHMPEKEYLKAFRTFDDGHMDERPFLSTQESNIRSPRGMPGGALSLSASGGNSGVLWVSAPKQDSTDALNTKGEFFGRLMAFDALTLEKLWEASDQPEPVPFAKYIPPTIGGGKVFRSAYANWIYVYGLAPHGAPVTTSLNRKITATAGVITAALTGGYTRRSVTALWRDTNHLDLFMSSRLPSGGSLLSTNWEAVCPAPPNPPAARGWRGWFPIDSNMDTKTDGQALPPGYTFTASGAAPVTALLAPPLSQGVEHVDLFVAANDGRVMSMVWETPLQSLQWAERWKGDGWKTWFPLASGAVVSPRQPITALWRPGSNHLDVFVVGKDGRVLSTFFEGRSWQPSWFAVTGNTPMAVPGQRVAAVWRNANHLDLFITDTGGHVMSTFFEGNKWQSGWFPIAPDSGVAAPGQSLTALWRPGATHLDLFMTDKSGHVMSIFFENTKWQTAWFPVNPVSGLAAPGQTISGVWRNAGHLDLFMTGKDGRIMSTYFDTNTWQPAWFPLSPNSATAAPGQEVFAVWAPGGNHLDLFITAEDGRVMSIFFDKNQWGPGWFPI
jgi:hypothetical protein